VEQTLTEDRLDTERDEAGEAKGGTEADATPGGAAAANAEAPPEGAPERPDEPVAAAEARAAAAEARAAEAHDKYLRVQAELDNVRKRAAREVAERVRYANEDLLREVLPAFDNLDRALEATAGEGGAVAAVREGLSLTQSQLMAVLRKHGVTPVEALGRPFDPTVHEAVQQVPSDQPAGTVVAEYRRGYVLNGRLVRPAMVAVAAPPAEGGAGDGSSPFEGA
jgi:molecular chaperone GrpE